MKFNINDKVKVKLTPLGKEILKIQHEDLYKQLPKETYQEYREPKEDKDGYSSFQLWDLMSRLGYACRMGFDNPFCTTILIDKKDLEE